MTDKIKNVKLEDKPIVDPSTQPLPPGIHPPHNIVAEEVDELQDKNEKTDVENADKQADNERVDKIASEEMPTDAYQKLYEMANTEGNDNIIFTAGEVRVLNLQPSTRTDEDYTMLNAIRAGVMEVSAPPPSIDLRSDWWGVSDQGNSGACVGFGVADGLLRYLFTKNKSISPGERLASGILWQAAKETDQWTDQATTFIALEGTSVKAALQFAQNKGIVRESVAPFGTLYTKDAPTFYRLAAQLRLSGVYNLGKNFQNWKQWLSTAGPIVGAINVDKSFESCPKDGMLNQYDVNRIYGGHCICFVGYTEDNRIIIRNSWGTGWGDKGFAYASVDWIMKACLEAYGAVI
jgi:hypothetical protein